MRDVWMVERGQQSRLALKAGQSIAVAGELVRQDFNGYRAAQLRIAGTIDLAHAADAEQGRDLEHAQAGTHGKRHERFYLDPDKRFLARHPAKDEAYQLRRANSSNGVAGMGHAMQSVGASKHA